MMKLHLSIANPDNTSDVTCCCFPPFSAGKRRQRKRLRVTSGLGKKVASGIGTKKLTSGPGTWKRHFRPGNPKGKNLARKKKHPKDIKHRIMDFKSLLNFSSIGSN
jgi:hypothetical protein